MTNTFTDVAYTDFAAEMNDMGFAVKAIDGTRETVFARDIPHTNFAVVIFSTYEDGAFRKTGADAIKVALWNNAKGRLIAAEKRVNRVGAAEDIIKRVRGKARECWAGAAKVEKCNCCDDGVMVLRKPKKGATWTAFKGCSNFPACKNTVR